MALSKIDLLDGFKETPENTMTIDLSGWMEQYNRDITKASETNRRRQINSEVAVSNFFQRS